MGKGEAGYESKTDGAVDTASYIYRLSENFGEDCEDPMAGKYTVRREPDLWLLA